MDTGDYGLSSPAGPATSPEISKRRHPLGPQVE